jgi:hypothetical protein
VFKSGIQLLSHILVNSEFWRLRQKYCDSEASTGCIVRPWLKRKRKKKAGIQRR